MKRKKSFAGLIMVLLVSWLFISPAFGIGFNIIKTLPYFSLGYDVTIANDIAYGACGPNGLFMLDVGNLNNPIPTGNVFPTCEASAIFYKDYYVYIADGTNGLMLLSVTNFNPSLRSNVDTDGVAYGVYVDGNYVYIADGTNGLQIIYAWDPWNAQKAGHYDTAGVALDVVVENGKAYIADGPGGLVVLDVSDPYHPAYLGGWNNGGYAEGLDVQNYFGLGDQVFLADGGHGLQIINANNPAALTRRSHVTTAWASGVKVSGGIAYIADGYDGVDAIHVSDLDHPRKLGEFDNGYAYNLDIYEGKLWVAAWTAGVDVIKPQRLPNDYDGDGVSDLAAYDTGTGNWYIRSLGPVGPAYPPICFGEQWGNAGMSAVPGDYNGDGVSDLAVYDYSVSHEGWSVKSLGGASSMGVDVSCGDMGALPLWGDYMFGNASCLAAYEAGAGIWKFKDASGFFGMSITNWGGVGLIPVPGDYNGDGHFDLALYETATGNWYIKDTWSTDPICFGQNWGGAGLIPVPGDYNGDAIYDLAVYHPGTGCWYIRSLGPIGPANPPICFGQQWGGPGLSPVPGDFNGDGVWDMALYQTSTGNWFIRSLGPVGPAYPPICFGQNWGGATLMPPGMVQ